MLNFLLIYLIPPPLFFFTQKNRYIQNVYTQYIQIKLKNESIKYLEVI